MKKILIIEDDRFLAKTYQRAFDPKVFDVKVLFDGEDALSNIKAYQPDLLLLDILLPVKNGFEILAEMKQDPATQAIPVVIASNLGQEEDFKKGIKLGATSFITKSETSLSEVVNVVVKTLQESKLD